MKYTTFGELKFGDVFRLHSYKGKYVKVGLFNRLAFCCSSLNRDPLMNFANDYRVIHLTHKKHRVNLFKLNIEKLLLRYHRDDIDRRLTYYPQVANFNLRDEDWFWWW